MFTVYDRIVDYDRHYIMMRQTWNRSSLSSHDDVITLKHFSHYWPFVRGIHRLPVNSPHKGQWCGAFMFSLISVRTNGWVNNRDAGHLRQHRAHYDVAAMAIPQIFDICLCIRHRVCISSACIHSKTVNIGYKTGQWYWVFRGMIL